MTESRSSSSTEHRRDGTVASIERAEPRLHYWESRPDNGIYHAWNKALDHVEGDWVYFLGADDRLAEPGVLLRVASRLSELPQDCSVAYGDVRVAAEEGSDEVVSRSWEQSRADFLLGRMIPHQGTFHRRSLFDRVGRFDESYRICGDYELLLRELPAHPPLYMEGLVVAEIGAAGVSRRPETFTTVLKELHRARRQHGYARSPAILDSAYIRSLTHAYLTAWVGRDFADRVGSAYRRLR